MCSVNARDSTKQISDAGFHKFCYLQKYLILITNKSTVSPNSETERDSVKESDAEEEVNEEEPDTEK
jgi:hypothetical protein